MDVSEIVRRTRGVPLPYRTHRSNFIVERKPSCISRRRTEPSDDDALQCMLEARVDIHESTFVHISWRSTLACRHKADLGFRVQNAISSPGSRMRLRLPFLRAFLRSYRAAKDNKYFTNHLSNEKQLEIILSILCRENSVTHISHCLAELYALFAPPSVTNT